MNSPLHPAAAFAAFPVIGNEIAIGGVPLTRLAQRIGRTPFYAYDRHRITVRLDELRQALPADVHVHYAVKANPMAAVVQHLARLVDGFDVASAAEMATALDTGASAERISFAGPGKTAGELAQAVAAGVTVNAESLREIEALAEVARRLALVPRVAVRVNPAFELKSSGMKMGGGPRPFGIDAEHVPAALERIRRLGLDFEGFHIFAGAQNLRADAIAEAQDKTVALALALAARAERAVRTLNLGGGFGIPYFPGDVPLDVRAVGARLDRALHEVRRTLPGTRVVLELGRYLVGEAGAYVCRILDRKISRGRVYLITDGGLHHHLAAAGLFGQVIRKNYPVIIGNRVNGAEREMVHVVGPLCTPLDVLAENVEVPRAEVGDLVVVLQSGAYGRTASPTAFLGHAPPAEVLV